MSKPQRHGCQGRASRAEGTTGAETLRWELVCHGQGHCGWSRVSAGVSQGAEAPGRGPRARSGRRGQRGQEGRDLPVCAQSMDVKSQGFEQEDNSRALDGDPCAMMGWDVGWS